MAETVKTAIAKKPTLRGRAEEMLALAQAVDVDPDTGETTGLEELEAAQAAFEEKASAVAVALRMARAYTETLKQYKLDIAARQKAAEAKCERLEAYLMDNMGRVGMKRLDTVEARVTLKDTEAVEVTDEQLVPMEYKKIKWEVSKTAIRDAIKAGETVDGARMVTHRSVIIK